MLDPGPDPDVTVSRIPPEAWELSLPPRNVDLVFDGAHEVVSCGPGAEDWVRQGGVLDALRRELGRRAPGWWSLPPLYVRCVALSGRGAPHYLLSVVPPRPELAEALAKLSPAQLQVAEFAASGATVREIAATLERSPETVRTHLKAVYDALWVGNRVELAHTLRRPAISYGK
ncbi:MAG: helix-turn-helix transcriptional regulator [Alphaproteobacteria bacterium]|nr:helix-turn-helix transcriptional regulator [Alphaproteobacteria bacterium]